MEGTGCLSVHGKPSLNLNQSTGWFRQGQGQTGSLVNEVVNVPGVVLDQVLQGEHVGSFVNEVVNPLLFYLKIKFRMIRSASIKFF